MRGGGNKGIEVRYNRVVRESKGGEREVVNYGREKGTVREVRAGRGGRR